MLATLHAWETRDRRLAIAQHYLNVCAEFAEQWAHNSFRLFEHRAEHVLGFDLLILVSLSKFDPCLNGFLSPKCKFV